MTAKPAALTASGALDEATRISVSLVGITVQGERGEVVRKGAANSPNPLIGAEYAPRGRYQLQAEFLRFVSSIFQPLYSLKLAH